MSPPKWTAEHGTLLKSLRQNAGLDVAMLARKHIVSTTQVDQLENGGDTAFYNPDIKFATGKKLLRALGHQMPEVDQGAAAVMTQTAPDIESVSAMNLVSLPPPPSLVGQGANRKAWHVTPQNFAWPLLLLLVALGLLGLYVERVPEVNTPELKEPAQMQIQLQTQPQTQIENVPPEQAAAQPASASSPQTVAAVQTKPPTAPCNWQATTVEIQPTSPRKPAEYVHLVAQQNVLVCIKDAEQRVATLEMQAGDARSIYGPAPFKVYSTQLSGMQIYFQGQAIKLPSEEVQLLQLTAAAR
jgi:hypothetical protein